MAQSVGDIDDSLVTLTVYSEGNKIEESYPVSKIRINKAVNKIATAQISLLDGDMPEQNFPISESDTFKPGSSIKIDAGYASDEQTIFEGIVTKQNIRLRSGSGSQIEIECKDKTVKMTVGRKNANFVDKKDSEIISQLISDNGLSAEVSATSLQHKEIVQYYASDWDFMLSRADANGLVVIADNGSISVKAPEVSGSASLKVSYGIDMLSMDLELDARNQLSAVQGTAWSIADQKIVQVKAANPSVNSHGDLDSSTLADVLGVTDYGIQSGTPMEQADLKAWTDAQLQRSWLSKIRGTVSFTGNASVAPGTLITIEGAGAHFNGDAYITGVRHELGDGAWTTEVSIGLDPESFSEQSNIAAPDASGVLPGIKGLQIGTVLKLDADPNGESMIQVSVPVLQASTEGVWARLANFYASSGIGAFFIPEVGDEVVLGYFNNDPRYPVVLGSMYSSKNAVPYDITADNFTKAIVTKEKMKIEFDEEKKVISITTPGDNKIVIDDDQKSILLNDQTGNKVELSDKGITLESPKDISIKATGKLSLESTGELSVKSSADVKVTGLNINNTANAGFVAKGSATAELSASGQTTVKGAMVMIN